MPVPASNLRAPLLWLLLPHLGGIALANAAAGPPIVHLPIAVGAILFAGLAFWLFCSERRGAVAFGLLALTAAGVGAGYLNFALRQPRAGIDAGVPREVVVTVEVDEVFPDKGARKSTNGLGRIVGTEPHLAAIRGIQIYFSAIRKISVPPFRSGRYLVRGVLAPHARTTEESPGFDRYLESRGVRMTLKRAQLIREERAPGWFPRFCVRAQRHLEKILSHGIERHTDAIAIYLGMLLGERAELSTEQHDAFTRSGTFHIFVIAGLHVGVIAGAIQAVLLLLRMPRRAAAIAGLGLLWLYVQVTGAGLPAHRAFVMIAFLQGARVFRRPGNSLAALALAAWFTLLVDPQELFSAGFQMSYAVVTGLVVMGAPLSRRWEAAWRPWRDLPEANWGWWRRLVTSRGQAVLGSLAISWVALLASTPSMIGNFGLLSPGSLLANLLIIPLAMAVIAAGFASLVFGLLFLSPASYLFNHAAALLIKTMEFLVNHGATLPGIYFPAQFVHPWMAPVATLGVVAAMLAGASLRWRRAIGGYWAPALTLAFVMFFGVKFG